MSMVADRYSLSPGGGSNKILVVLICVPLILGGCGKAMQFKIGQTSQSFTQNGSTIKNSLDILWVVDNSSSMSPLQTNLTNNFDSFISKFTAQGYDFHMSVTTTDAYRSEVNFQNNPSLAKFVDGVGTSHSGVFVILPTTPNLDNTFLINASQGTNGSGDERAFSSMRDALSSSLNTGFLRSNSFLAIIILSDEDDFSGAGRPEYSWNQQGGIPDHDYGAPTLDPESMYINYLDTLTQTTGTSRRYNINTIAVLDQICYQSHLQNSPATIIGQRYMDLASQTNGIQGDICAPSYADALSQISNQITVLSTQFYLDRIPQIPTIQVFVNGIGVIQDPTNGWTYNSGSNSIQFHGSSTPAQNAVVTIDYTPVAIGR